MVFRMIENVSIRSPLALYASRVLFSSTAISLPLAHACQEDWSPHPPKMIPFQSKSSFTLIKMTSGVKSTDGEPTKRTCIDRWFTDGFRDCKYWIGKVTLERGIIRMSIWRIIAEMYSSPASQPVRFMCINEPLISYRKKHDRYLNVYKVCTVSDRVETIKHKHGRDIPVSVKTSHTKSTEMPGYTDHSRLSWFMHRFRNCITSFQSSSCPDYIALLQITTRHALSVTCYWWRDALHKAPTNVKI